MFQHVELTPTWCPDLAFSGYDALGRPYLRTKSVRVSWPLGSATLHPRTSNPRIKRILEQLHATDAETNYDDEEYFDLTPHTPAMVTTIVTLIIIIFTCVTLTLIVRCCRRTCTTTTEVQDPSDDETTKATESKDTNSKNKSTKLTKNQGGLLSIKVPWF